MKRKKMQRVKSGVLAMIFGLSMMMTAPVSVKAEAAPPDSVSVCFDCGTAMTYQGCMDRGWSPISETQHEYTIGHYYQCAKGHVRYIIESVASEDHSKDRYKDEGHRTCPGELFGEHTYTLKCKCGKEYETVTIICDYPGRNSHNTPF